MFVFYNVGVTRFEGAADVEQRRRWSEPLRDRANQGLRQILVLEDPGDSRGRVAERRHGSLAAFAMSASKANPVIAGASQFEHDQNHRDRRLDQHHPEEAERAGEGKDEEVQKEQPRPDQHHPCR